MNERARPGQPRRRDRLVQPHDHDPYRPKGKLSDPTGCPTCGAAFREGRWTWRTAPAGSPEAVCPACRRIQDDYPAGYLRLEGDFLGEHEADLRGLIEHVEERERREHPLKRVMAIREEEGGLLVTTTDAQLAHAIASALHKAYRGDLESRWADDENLLRATWRR